jgi:hypothetical protein
LKFLLETFALLLLELRRLSDLHYFLWNYRRYTYWRYLHFIFTLGTFLWIFSGSQGAIDDSFSLYYSLWNYRRELIAGDTSILNFQTTIFFGISSSLLETFFNMTVDVS